MGTFLFNLNVLFLISHLYLQEGICQCFFRYCINIAKLIRSCEDIQIRISFVLDLLHFLLYLSFNLPEAGRKKRNFFILGRILLSDEKLLWWQGLSAAFCQFRF